MARPKRGLRNTLIFGVTLLAVCSMGLLGWNWLGGLTLGKVDVSGNVQAASEELIDAARVDTGGLLFDIDPEMIADRVQRHPWVKTADVIRLPPGTLSIRIREREPVVLVIDSKGIPSSYLDIEGYMMPVTSTSSFDLPLLTGITLPANPTRPVENGELMDLLQATAQLSPETDVLISSFEMERSGRVSLRTAPIDGRGSIDVRLGRRDFGSKLRQLNAFWQDAVVTRPHTRYEWIDLRFDGQIVTREISGT